LLLLFFDKAGQCQLAAQIVVVGVAGKLMGEPIRFKFRAVGQNDPRLGIGIDRPFIVRPGIELPWGAKWTIIGFAPAYNAAGEVIIGGGLGYTISFWIGSFLAQCINFPLQRNITYKSKGKIPFQIMWYFIAWVLITFATTALNSLWLPLAAEHLPTALYQVINTVVVGGISMVIFFPIFKIVFPEGEPKKENELTKEEKQN